MSEVTGESGARILRGLSGATIVRVGCIASTGFDGNPMIESLTMALADGRRVSIKAEFWSAGDMPWLEITESARASERRASP